MGGLCGIIQFDGAPITAEAITRMASESAFRGPDGISITFQDGFGVAHLAHHTTLESQREHQPLSSRDGKVFLVADARIDNRPELISQLNLSSVDPQPTDADLILTAYLKWGEDCFAKLVGDFALFIHDGRTQTSYVARDAVGTRPLHYHHSPKHLIVASDALQILTVPGVPDDLDGYRVLQFLAGGCQPRHRTMFIAVHSVLPGHAIAFPREGRPRAWRHWRPHLLPPIDFPLAQDYVRHFRELLERSVADRMRIARGRAAVMLSGGLDSSAVLALCADHSVRSGAPAPFAASMVLADPAHQEISFARDVCGYHATELQELEMGRAFPFSEVLETGLRPEAPWLTPGPGNGSLLHLQIVANSNGSILFNGFGGDSLFEASPLAAALQFQRKNWRETISWTRVMLRGHPRPFLRLVRFGIERFAPNRIVDLLAPIRNRRRIAALPPWLTPRSKMRLMELQELETDALPTRYSCPARQIHWTLSLHFGSQGPAITFWNRAAAEHGMEVRMPLMDRRLAEFLLLCPTEVWAGPQFSVTKWLLRESLKGLLPESVRTRAGKTGVGNFYDEGLKDPSIRGEFARRIPLLATAGLVDSLHLIDDTGSSGRPNGRRYRSDRLYRLVQMEFWFRRFASNRNLVFAAVGDWSVEQEKGAS